MLSGFTQGCPLFRVGRGYPDAAHYGVPLTVTRHNLNGVPYIRPLCDGAAHPVFQVHTKEELCRRS